MSPYQPDRVASAERTRLWTAAAFLFAFVAASFHFGQFLTDAIAAIRDPWELDYGEGIVWEQMRLMVAGRGYGPIDGFPAIVFHYPPVFHMVTAGIAAISGADGLAAGRSVAFGSTMIIALFAGLIAAVTVATDAPRRTAAVCGLVAGLTTLCFAPVNFWAVLMRVDMLSIALSLAGVLAAMAALKKPAFIGASAVLFVAAVYTKQISIVAPAAVFITYLVLRPKLAWALAAGCMILGLPALLALQLATDGGFVRHIFLYNVNRFDPARLVAIPAAIVTHLLFAAALLVGITARVRERLPHYRDSKTIAVLRQRLLASPGDAFFMLILIYAALASVMSLAIVKSGSNVNYLIETMAVLSILMGIVARNAADAALGVRQSVSKELWSQPAFLPAMIGLQVLLLTPMTGHNENSTKRVAELETLQAMIRSASRPVISDDIVLLIRSGATVQWEPAIFSELAQTGAWDETPFLERIKHRKFAFFITSNVRGSALFDLRDNLAVSHAMASTYPVRRQVANYTIHLPADYNMR